MTQCHVSFAISFFIITCVSFATSPSHCHLHGICCSHTCTYGLITCVSHINTISPPRLSLNYQNQTRTFHLLTRAPVPSPNNRTRRSPMISIQRQFFATGRVRLGVTVHRPEVQSFFSSTRQHFETDVSVRHLLTCRRPSASGHIHWAVSGHSPNTPKRATFVYKSPYACVLAYFHKYF